MIKLCKQCARYNAAKLARIIDLAKHGCWLYPCGFEQCGMVDGKTQAELFKKAVLEMLSEHDNGKQN